MERPPLLTTERLVLRPFERADAKEVQILAGDKRIADTTKNIPHPYPDGLAEAWIASHEDGWRLGTGLTYAVTKSAKNTLIGAVGLVQIQATEAEIGYWIGVPYWNHGYCTEAVRALIAFCFSELSLERLHAKHLARNPASGRVLRKSGLSQIGGAFEEQWKNEGAVAIERYEICRSP